MNTIKTLRNTNFTGNTLKDLVCFSHLRWDFVYQRPQHLMTRFSRHYRVFFIEEPIHDCESSFCEVINVDEYLWRIVPHLQKGLTEAQVVLTQQTLLKQLFLDFEINNYLFWYYTPMAQAISNHFTPQLIVYDCMDELSHFKFAPPSLVQKEKELFDKADIVFTGGHNLYNYKKDKHSNIHPFPSSIDKDHFSKGRLKTADPEDQANIPSCRFGFYGVIDERFNIDLLREVAERKPEWQFVIIGPVVKIDPETLPRLQNIHYLGGKSYKELPQYLAGWDVAMIPFMLNDSTKFISPTKTPEYLSAGKPVISTSIIDVVTPYGKKNLVQIADTAEEFIAAGEIALEMKTDKKWLKKVDAFLESDSWDSTWARMMQLLIQTFQIKKNKQSADVNDIKTNNHVINLNKRAYV